MGSRGPAPNPPLSAYVEAVRTLHDTNPDTGVPVDAVAAHLDVHRETARRHLEGLYEGGALDRTKGGEPLPGDPWFYLPPERDGG